MLIPQTITTTNEETNQVYRTYKIDLENKRIVGMVDGYDSIVQNVLKTLLTERYAYEIYSSDIGVELSKYIGKDFDYVKADLKVAIKDALRLDERITNFQNIEIVRKDVDVIEAKITIDTIEGTITFIEEVNI